MFVGCRAHLSNDRCDARHRANASDTQLHFLDLDPALLRPGRFDRQVLVDRPDRSGRLQILKVHVAKIRLADGVDLDQIAGLTTGFTGADLANLVNEAAIVATRRKADAAMILPRRSNASSRDLKRRAAS